MPPASAPLPSGASLLDALRHYEAQFRAHCERLPRAPGRRHLDASFAHLQALQRQRMPMLADAFELLEHVHHGALRHSPPPARMREQHALIVGECMELVQQVN